MSRRKLLPGAILAASVLAGAPTLAQAHQYDYGSRRAPYGRYYEPAQYGYNYAAPRRDDRDSCRTSGTTGLIIGGAAGALLGRELDGGRSRATGTLVGAGAGALLGREIARKSRC